MYFKRIMDQQPDLPALQNHDLSRGAIRLKTILLSFCIIALLQIGCTAYFNTYYNAETAFKQAQVLHKAILRNYPDSLVVTPPANISVKYDRTIDKSIKMIETFPKSKKWHDNALLLMGKAHFYKKENEKAIRRFRQLEQEFPTSELLPEAYLYMGKAYIESENLDKAEEVLQTAEKRFPELNVNQQITLLLITIAIRREGKAQAIALLEKTRKSVKSEELRIELMLRTAELYIDLKQYGKAISLLERAPRRKKFPQQSFRIDRSLFSCYQAIDSLQQAFDLIETMIAQKQYYPYMDELLFYQGILLNEMGKTDDAVKIFKKLTADIDTATASTDTSTFKARALYQLALIYQKQKEDYGKAHSYLQLASMTTDTATGRLAKKRLSAFDLLTKLREESGKGDSAQSGRSFTIGELFRFELDEPDSAFEQFMHLARDSVTDTAIIPKALCQAALIARDDLHDTVTCDSIFTSIIARYPASEYAKTGQEALRMKVTIKTRQDSASEAYRDAEHRLYQKNDVKGAIRSFFEVSKQYPELPIAAKSLYAAAWFSDNVLYKNVTAKKLYEKICEKYPETIYCTEQAKPRMKIVADTLAKLDQLRRENEKHIQNQKKVPVAKDTITQKPGSDISGQSSGIAGESVEPLSAEEIADEGRTPADTALPAAADDSTAGARGDTQQP
jgi:TolA-binding protein